MEELYIKINGSLYPVLSVSEVQWGLSLCRLAFYSCCCPCRRGEVGIYYFSYKVNGKKKIRYYRGSTGAQEEYWAVMQNMEILCKKLNEKKELNEEKKLI